MSTRVDWPVYVVFGLLGGFLVWVLVFPDRAWRVERAFVGWQYRDGDRIELSDAGRLWVRFWTLVTLGGLVAFSAATINWSADSRVETDSSASRGTVYHVGDPVESPGCTVRVFVCLKSDDVFPIEVEGYTATDGPNRLLLYVDDRFFPTHIVMEQDVGQVTVSLYGKCAPWPWWDDAYGDSPADCRGDSINPPFDRGVVPVSLEAPLGGRSLIDGSRDAAVEREA